MSARVQEVLYKRPKLILPQMTITNWSGFTNQPANDGVEILSNSASDVCKCTIWGTTYGTNAVVSETVTLTGTSAVSTTKTNWGNIYGVLLADKDGKNITATVGTVTVREASGNLAITTISAGYYHSGMLILEIPGDEFEVSNFSGNLYWNNLAIATATNGIKTTGSTSITSSTRNRISFISDNTGSLMQLVLIEG